MAEAALNRLIERVRGASADRRTLEICGGGTKSFYGEPARGDPMDVREFAGISGYEPSELVVTARAGTPLAVLEQTLAEQGQCLAFEPPRFREGTTVGGMVAAGLSGPARATAGSLRDHLLGATLLNGRAQCLTFGGRVMKNVAGYDVSRLLAGSLGIFGVICEVSLKVMPKPVATRTLRFGMSEVDALMALNGWAAKSLPVSATSWHDGLLLLRLSGAPAAVSAAERVLGGVTMAAEAAEQHWLQLRDHRRAFFIATACGGPGASLWRLSLPSNAAALALPGKQLIEWGGALRWLATGAPAAQVRSAAQRAGGHATLFHASGKSSGVFTPLSPPLARIHRQLKKAFDPDGVFNPGRLYPDL